MSEEDESPVQGVDSPAPASPVATGGKGTLFEQHVGAFFLGLFLTKGVPPCFTDSYVSGVHLQTRNDGWYTDDILVEAVDQEGVHRKIALQVKLAFSITEGESNEECREVISGACKRRLKGEAAIGAVEK